MFSVRFDAHVKRAPAAQRTYSSCAALLLLIFCAVLGPASASPAATDLSKLVLLVAQPQLGDFYRGTILLAKPLGNEGHVGFIINRPTQMTLGKLFPEHGPSQQVADPVYLGGPENTNMIFAIVNSATTPGGRSVRLTDDLFLAVEGDIVDHIIEAESDHARFFAGLVAWRPGELEHEIDQGFWYTLDVDPSLVLRKSTTGLWEELVRRSEMRSHGI